MATNIDERIVAAKFDASDFEKGVNKTIKKLDELKDKLDLKEATKGVEEFAKKTESSTESMSKSLDKLTERFTTFVGMVKQKILSGLADEVAGVFLKMEQSVKGFIKGISSDQVSAGMSKYEQMLSSVRTMMAAGESEGSAYEAIGRLRDYSDQTSYSLSQMTDALSKLRAAGVDLDTAQKSVEGIANACANAGINATDAQRAFFNLSQAYSSGVLKYTDYRSLELLNMTTEKFKENILEAAVNAGTLKKTSEDVYQTINKNNKKVTAGKKVTKQNLQDMLRYNFVTSDVMNELFGGTFFFDEQKFKEYKKKYNTLDEAIAAAKKDYGETAVNAYLAAREARSFTDVINTLKDVVSTGWSTTFEHLFGKLEEAKDFFTQLAEGELADVVYKIGEYRNAILGFWDDGVGDTGGGAVFRQTILNLTDALGELLKTFLQILPGFEELNYEEDEATPGLEKLGDKLFMLSMKIRDFSERVKEAAQNFKAFMNDKTFDDGNGGKMSRIDKLREVFANLSSVLNIFGRVALIAFSAVSKAFYTLSPILDGFLQLLSKVTEPLVNLKNNTKVFKDVEHSIDNILTVLQPVANVLGQIIGFLAEVAGFIAQMAIDSLTSNISFFADVLGLVIELITGNSAQMKDGEGVLANIRKDFEGIKEACRTGLKAINDFFGALLSDIKKLLGIKDEATEGQDDQNGGVFSGLINFFNTNQFVQDAKAWVNQAIIDVGNFVKSIPDRVLQFGANIYDTLRKLFFTEQPGEGDEQAETKTILTPLGEWVVKAADDVKNWFKDLPNKILKAVGDIGNWIDEVFNSWFGKKNVEAKQVKEGDLVEKQTQEIESRFQLFIQEIAKSVTDWFNDLPNKIQKAFKSVGDFASKLLGAIDEFLFGKKITKKVARIDPLAGNSEFKKITVRYKTGFSKWLDGVIKDIKKFIQNIPTYVKAGIKGAGDIISTVIGSLFGKPDDKEVTKEDVEKRIEKPFLGINLSNVLNTIRDIGTEILNQIARMFTGTDDVEANADWFSTIVANSIEWIREKAKIALDWVLEFLIDVPNKIASFFKGEDKENPERGKVGSAIIGFGETIGKFIIEDLPSKILELVNNAANAFDTIWTTLYNSIIGDSEKKSEEAAEESKEAVEKSALENANPNLSAWEKFIQKLGETISNIWQQLPVWIANGIDLAIIEIGKLIDNIGQWLNDVGVQEKAADAAETVVADTTEEVAKSAEEGEGKKEPRLVTAIKSIGKHIQTLFVEIIPGFIKDAWTLISQKGSELFEGISSIFTGKTPESEIGKYVNQFGTMIYNFITQDIPTFIKKAFDFIGGLFNKDKNAWKKNISGGDEIYKEVVSAVESQQRQANERLEKDTEKSDFWSFADGLKESFLNAFHSIGPAILNGISKALDWIGSIIEIVVKAITGKESIGDQVEAAYKKENPKLKAALSNIGESLRKFFLDTIPRFLGSAIGAIAENAGEWLSKLFSAMGEAAKSEEEKAAKKVEQTTPEEAVENAINIMDIVHELFGKLAVFAGENIVGIIGVVVALSLLFGRLSDLFSLADELEAGAQIVKWVAVTMAISAIAGILAYITEMLKENDPEKITRFEGIIDKLAGLFEKIAWVIGLFTAGKIAEAVGDIGSSSASKEKVGLKEKFVGGLIDSVTGFFKSIGIATGTAIGIEVAGASVEDFLATVSASFTGLASGIDDMLKILLPFVDDLANINTKLDMAISSATKMADLFTTLYNVFGELYKNTAGKDAEREKGTNIYATEDVIGNYKTPTTIEQFLLNMQQRVELFMQLATFINHVVTALHTLDNIDDAEKTLNELKGLVIDSNFADFLTQLMNTLEAAVKASNIDPGKLGKTQYISLRESGIDIALSMLSDALSIFSSSFSGLNKENVDAFSEALKVIEHMYGIMGDVDVVKSNSLARMILGDKSLSALGREIKLFGMYMKTFYENIIDIPGFDASEVDKTQSKVDSVIIVAKGMAEAANSLEALINGELLSEFGAKLPELGTQIGEFIKNMNQTMGSISAERVELVATATEALANLASLMSVFVFNQDDIVDKMYNSISGSKGEKFAATLRSFLDALRNSLVESDKNNEIFDLGKEIATRLHEGIQSAFDEDPTLRIQITPVLKLDEETKGALRQQLIDAGIALDTTSLANSVTGANNVTDAERVTATLFTEKMDILSSAVSDLKNAQTTVDQLTDAMTHMGVYLNKGYLLGAIHKDIGDIADDVIGMKINQINMSITPG